MTKNAVRFMDFLVFLSGCVIPLVFFGIVVYGLLQHVDIFDTFVEGAKDGFMTVYKILPTLIWYRTFKRVRSFKCTGGFFVAPYGSFSFSGTACSSCDCKNVFIFGSDKSSVRCL